ncbi:hypothetical protein PORCRE_990 [Porphyromonas crevioricanis JCM 15906]|uniref:Polyketide cyclase n=2 Tax=Porphyromonas crevioricanis TaxID=393921 RepID=A0A2X4SGU1_9PORP|nr:SRPBCC family protein [Porphyromonas crevioricanis]KGN94989.1 polyketide cyclase [Porphyromonas crevioricanis]SJZ52473.1 Polyketide cyclase / dehydrase and lipid transport [Porphyromonas crevioricanis]SQH73212.1 Uncharacterised protein [Porphyromonas crevioricanis]GAD05290.1 hypothetical protein PORCRE_990 [Porphyromonas crevioricanis JCM 15906]GAD06632.1 hypothetical protein PORCAN_230 [Porphyromonas crevioricanis JCM 13913]
MTEYTSQIKRIEKPAEQVFGKLSDLSNLNFVKDKIPDKSITLEHADTDSCTLKLNPMGALELRVVEREPYKTIKMQTERSPLPFTFWIQLVEKEPDHCFLRLTLHAELNMFVKKMIGKKLEGGIDQLANMLAALPY